MADTTKDFIWVGDEAVQYLKDSFLLQNKVDILILHAADDQDVALAFAFELQQIWEHKAIPFLETFTAQKNAENPQTEEEGVDVIDSYGPPPAGYFANLTDCDQCCAETVPKPKIAVLDVTALSRSEFLEELRGQVLYEKAFLMPILTKAFLSQPDFLIRSYYLKLAVRGSNDHVLPIIPTVVNLPNYLFDHLNPIHLYRCDKWGQMKTGMHNYMKERLKCRLIDMLAKKIARRGRECPHPIPNLKKRQKMGD